MGKGKEIPSRVGFTYTALVGTTLDRQELTNAIAGAINNPPLKCTGEWITDRRYKITQSGLQKHFELSRTPEHFFRVVLQTSQTTPCSSP
jgi:hypothetical protein